MCSSVPRAALLSLLACLQTFVKAVNYNHLMPTRYTLEVDLKGVVGPESLENSSKKAEARKVSNSTPLYVVAAVPCGSRCCLPFAWHHEDGRVCRLSASMHHANSLQGQHA